MRGKLALTSDKHIADHRSHALKAGFSTGKSHRFRLYLLNFLEQSSESLIEVKLYLLEARDVLE